MAGAGWSCSHEKSGMCDLLKIECDPGHKGCVLYGKCLFSNPTSPSNEAFQRREKLREKKEEFKFDPKAN